MSKQSVARLGIAALFLAWSFDQLFWDKAPGISFFLFIALCVGAGVLLTLGERLRPPASSLVLLALVLFFAAITFFRSEPFTLFVCGALALGGVALLSMTWLGGRWWQYNLLDYARNALRWTGLSLIRLFEIFPAAWRKAGAAGVATDGDPAEAAPPAGRGPLPARPALALLVGLLLALPVVALLGALLASADPIFSQQLQNVLHFLDLEKLDEYLFRLIYIVFLAYLLGGVLLYALLASQDEHRSADRPGTGPLALGWLEAVTVLGCVDLLFVVFVLVQIRYFFGGQANIRLEGFTYAEYARRGFNELVAVAVLSLLLFLLLSAVTRRETGLPRRLFSALGIGLVGLVAVILVSAFQRLLLYEAAYGFSRIRIYTHVFMLWLGLLLLATALLEGFRRLRYFALAAVLAAAGFGATLALLNVDNFIARQNLQRAAQGAELDTQYLATLSDDAVPVLFSALENPALSPGARQELGAGLACRAALAETMSSARAWPSYHGPRARAEGLYTAYHADLAPYRVWQSDGNWWVQFDALDQPCFTQSEPFD